MAERALELVAISPRWDDNRRTLPDGIDAEHFDECTVFVRPAHASTRSEVERARARHADLLTLGSMTDVLPFRLGSTVASRRELEAYIRLRGDALLKAIASVRGCVEYTLWLHDSMQVSQETVASDHLGFGTAYLQCRRAAFAQADNKLIELRVRVRERFNDVLDRVERWEIEGPTARRSKPAVLCLVSRESEDEFVARARQSHAERVVGPLPPVSFALMS